MIKVCAGGVGLETVYQALSEGYKVRALARNPSRCANLYLDQQFPFLLHMALPHASLSMNRAYPRFFVAVEITSSDPDRAFNCVLSPLLCSVVVPPGSGGAARAGQPLSSPDLTVIPGDVTKWATPARPGPARCADSLGSRPAGEGEDGGIADADERRGREG